MKLTIGKRIAMGFGTIFIILTCVGIFNYYTMTDMHQDIEVAKDEIGAQTLTVLDMLIEVVEIQGLLTDASLTKSKEPIEEAKVMATAFKKLLAEFIAREKNQETLKTMDKMRVDFDEYWDTGIKMIAAYGESQKDGNLVMEEFDADSAKIMEDLEALREEHVNELNAHYLMMESDADNNVLVTSITFALLIICGILFSTMLIRSIVSALTRITESLSEASAQTASASSQLAGAAQELSSGANEQASSIEETSSSLEEMSGMVENNVTNAENSVKLSEDVKGESEKGNHSMEQLQNSMQEILASNEKIEELVKVIGNIGDKTQVMDEIVFQTKLLSFNASVEAERAGEHGRGFAVVAQEVGNLAQMSGKAAQEIAVIVKDSISNAETITTENKKKVEQGNDYVSETAKVLQGIMNSSGTVTEGANQVLSASKDQSNGIKQINDAMGQLDKATQENAATAEETASTSEELNAQTETLDRLVNELTVLVKGENSISQTSQQSGRGNQQTKKSAQVLKIRSHKGEPDHNEEHPQMAKASGDDSWEKL